MTSVIDKNKIQCYSFILKNKKYFLFIYKTAVFDTPSITWLHNQVIYPKVYWKEKEHIKITLGISYKCDNFPFIEKTNENISFFYKMGFDNKNKDHLWKPFLNEKYFLPTIEIEKDILKINFVSSENDIIKAREFLKNTLTNLQRAKEKIPSYDFNIEDRHDTPSYEKWKELVSSSLNHIKKNTFKKIVLSRKTQLSANKKISIHSLLEKLNDQEKNFLCFYQISKENAFFSLSPERLFTRKNKDILSDSIAGTNNLSNNMFDKKNISEFEITKKSINDVFDKICKNYKTSPTTHLQLKNLQHLHCIFSGILKENISDEEILADLHPTGAICGYPKKSSLDFLAKNKPFNRGLYSSPIGFIGNHTTCLYVAIRSFLIDENKAYLFSGTGIVTGSIEKDEWEELEIKIKQLKKCLNHE
jgi:menaquinone-specific isochorismate synthase